jgi:hypothetical protein
MHKNVWFWGVLLFADRRHQTIGKVTDKRDRDEGGGAGQESELIVNEGVPGNHEVAFKRRPWGWWKNGASAATTISQPASRIPG